MRAKIAKFLEAIRSVRKDNLDKAIRDALAREEENGAAALLWFRLVIFIFFVFGGVTAATHTSDLITNLTFAGGYGLVLALQWHLLRSRMHAALHRFSYVMNFCDHALFAGLLIFYYHAAGHGNFNHVLKSPYVVMLLVPTLTTLVQFRQKLLVFSILTLELTLIAFLVFALIANVPQTTDWTRYILADAIILQAWASLWILVGLICASIVWYTILRSIRLIIEISRAETQKNQLARYFSPAVAEEIAAAQSSGALMQGSRRPVAILFADIRSFTTLSENMPPDEVANMLSELRQLQMQAVFDAGGMVDKFIGDAIMAVFGAPKSLGSFTADVRACVSAGLKMHSALVDFNRKRVENKQEAIRIGVGIHAGEAFAGNLGGEGQLEYTVIGDVVNTASRIEHLCKKAGADFLISETVAHELSAGVNHEKIGLVKIRGREKPMAIHKVLH